MKKSIDTSLNNLQELLARCPNQVGNGIIECIQAQFCDDSDPNRQQKLELLRNSLSEAHRRKRERRHQRRAERLKTSLEATESSSNDNSALKPNIIPDAYLLSDSTGKVTTPEPVFFAGNPFITSSIPSPNCTLPTQYLAAKAKSRSLPSLTEPAKKPLTFISAEMLQVVMRQHLTITKVDLLNAYFQTVLTGVISDVDFENRADPLLEMLNIGVAQGILEHRPKTPQDKRQGWRHVCRSFKRLEHFSREMLEFKRRMELF